MEELDQLLKRKDLRSADRAAMKNLSKKLRKREALTYQERQNLYAYLNRYRREAG